MYWLKACARCGGDLYESADQHGRYVACLQCSRYFIEEERARLETLPSKEALLTLATTEREQVAA